MPESTPQNPENDVGEPQFMGLNPQHGRNAHNFRISIHNLWDEWRRNFPDSSIICGTA
jgi:hypothetical protein